MAEQTIWCLWCLRSHPAPVAVAANDVCPSNRPPDLMAALEASLSAARPSRDSEPKEAS